MLGIEKTQRTHRYTFVLRPFTKIPGWLKETTGNEAMASMVRLGWLYATDMLTLTLTPTLMLTQHSANTHLDEVAESLITYTLTEGSSPTPSTRGGIRTKSIRLQRTALPTASPCIHPRNVRKGYMSTKRSCPA